MSFLQGLNTSATIWRDTGGDVVVQDSQEALLRQIVTYASNGKDITSVTANGGNTGTGKFDNLHSGPGAPAETWTITMITGTTFTVSGGTSTGQANGTVDVAYRTNGTTENALLQFTLDSNAANGDTWTIVAAAFSPAIAAADIWILDRWRPNGNLFGNPDSLIWHGEGAGGTEAIHTGIKLSVDVPSGRYSWILRNFTGFTSSGDWSAQPGSSKQVFCPFDNNNFEYWFVVSGRRYVVVGKPAAAVDVSLYQGFIDAYGSPGEYPFPSIVIGSSDFDIPDTDLSNDFHTLVTPANQGELRDTAGAWLDYDDDGSPGKVRGGFNHVGSTNPVIVWDNVQNLGTDDQLLPFIIFSGPSPTNEPLTMQVFGELEGVAALSGFNLTSSSVLTVGADTWVAFTDAFRADRQHFWALKME